MGYRRRPALAAPLSESRVSLFIAQSELTAGRDRACRFSAPIRFRCGAESATSLASRRAWVTATLAQACITPNSCSSLGPPDVGAKSPGEAETPAAKHLLPGRSDPSPKRSRARRLVLPNIGFEPTKTRVQFFSEYARMPSWVVSVSTPLDTVPVPGVVASTRMVNEVPETV